MPRNTPATTDAPSYEDLTRRVHRLETIIAAKFGDGDADPGGNDGLSRRGFLARAGGAALVGSALYVGDVEELFTGEVRADPNPSPSELDGTIFVDTIEANQLNVNVQEDTHITSEIELSGPFTQQVDGPDTVSGSVALDVSADDLFNLDIDGTTSLSLTNDGHSLDGQGIAVVMHGSGDSVSYPTEFDFGDLGSPDDPGASEIVTVGAFRIVEPDTSVTWQAFELWRSA